MHRVLDIASTVDLAKFSQWLDRQGVIHRISEEGDVQVLWVENELEIVPIQDVLKRYLQESEVRQVIDGGGDSQMSQPRRMPLITNYPRPNFYEAPVVFFCMALCGLVAALTSFGEGGKVLRFFLIVNPFLVEADLNVVSGRLDGLWQLVSQGQLWRLVGPDFIHFHVPHLAFNMLLLWLFGGQIEKRFGSLWFILFFVFVSAVSNVAQLIDSGYLFGGMSGVAFGIVGFCWYAQRQGLPGLFFPSAIFNVSVVWLILGYTPIFQTLGLGNMANSAHLFGLIAGMLWAVVHFRFTIKM